MATFQFDATKVAPRDSFDLIPAGKYIAQISASEIKPTKNNTGQVLNLTWDILDGQFKGRKVFDRVNISNQNPEAERIGQQQLSGICHATGVLNLRDTSQLHMKPIMIKVKVRPAEGQYDASNDVSSYEAIKGAAPAGASFQPPAASPGFGFAAHAAATVPTTAAAPAAGSAPPWLAGQPAV